MKNINYKISDKDCDYLENKHCKEYIRYFSENDLNGIEVVLGHAEMIIGDNNLKVSTTSNAIIIDKKSPEFYNGEIEFKFKPAKDFGNFGVVLRYAGEDSWTYIGQIGKNDEWGTYWYVVNSKGEKRKLFIDSARIYSRRIHPYTVKIKLVGKVVTIYLDGVEIFNDVVLEVTEEKGLSGVRFHDGAGGDIQYLLVSTNGLINNIEEVNCKEVEISSEELKVIMDDKFPRVLGYELISNGRKIYGQDIPNYLVEINTKRYIPKITSDFKKDYATYNVSIDEIGVSFDVNYKVINNILNMNIKNINEKKTRVYTINFPENSLVSVRSNQSGVRLTARNHFEKVSRDLTISKEDETYGVTEIAVVNSSELAATILNSSIKANREVAYKTFKVNNEYYSTGLWTNEYMYRGVYDGEIIEEPWAKVAITADRNNDNKVDWIDGAIAYRDDLRKERFGANIVRNSYSSVAINVGSVAQYPFLRILDNIKKLNLGIDGFQQSVIVKGYQSEGHDASHIDYDNFNERAGGLEDFKVLVEEAKKYNSYVGVHINHTEAYPECKQFRPELVSDVEAWLWYDQSKYIIRENDIIDKEQGLGRRIEDFVNSAPGQDWIYVDVYSDTRWPAHKLSSKIHEVGLPVATEYTFALPQKSIWSHSLTDEFQEAGDLIYFVNHQEQEIFKSSNLFRGPKDRINGILGWQGAVDYNEAIKDFYTNILPNKYLMNFPMSQWESNSKAVLGKNNEVVTTYEDRINRITKDNKLIAEGNKIFIPWNPENEEKIYHWTDVNGESIWELPETWANLDKVVLYRLSDKGRGDKALVKVINGKITLNTLANVPYVIYKEEVINNRDMEWGKGSLVKDMGFDSHTWGYAWNKLSSYDNTNHINFINNNIGNTHIRVAGNNGADAIISQIITGLVGGETYSASAWIEVSEGRKAEIIVTTTEGKEISNYIDRSNVVYGSMHSDKYNSYYQRVKLTFKQPENETTADLKLIARKGDINSWVNFDDVRIMKIGVCERKGYYFFEDFENVDQGYGPFESINSDNTHLSESNEPYTDDTICGKYSLKVREGDYLRTLPHRIRFNSNTKYKVGLSHLASVDEAFILGIKSDKAKEADDYENMILINKKVSKIGTTEIEFKTGNYDDYYIDITMNNSKEYVIDNLYVYEIN